MIGTHFCRNQYCVMYRKCSMSECAFTLEQLRTGIDHWFRPTYYKSKKGYRYVTCAAAKRSQRVATRSLDYVGKGEFR